MLQPRFLVVVVALILLSYVGCSDQGPSEVSPPSASSELYLVSDTIGEACAWTDCRPPTNTEWIEIWDLFYAYSHSDPLCNTLIKHHAWTVLNSDRLFISQSDLWLGGPFEGQWYNGAFDHDHDVMFIKDDYLSSPGEFIKWTLHEAAHRHFGPNSEPQASFYDDYCVI